MGSCCITGHDRNGRESLPAQYERAPDMGRGQQHESMVWLLRPIIRAGRWSYQRVG